MSDPTRPIARRGAPPRSEHLRPDKGGVSWKTWAVLILIALSAIIALQNSQEVAVRVLFFADLRMPLILALLVAGAVGAVIGYSAPVLLRHRRKERSREKDDS